jgi:Cdc6-like AAA superfamily ATPase
VYWCETIHLWRIHVTKQLVNHLLSLALVANDIDGLYVLRQHSPVQRKHASFILDELQLLIKQNSNVILIFRLNSAEKCILIPIVHAVFLPAKYTQHESQHRLAIMMLCLNKIYLFCAAAR